MDGCNKDETYTSLESTSEEAHLGSHIMTTNSIIAPIAHHTHCGSIEHSMLVHMLWPDGSRLINYSQVVVYLLLSYLFPFCFYRVYDVPGALD